jgi:hypothetical protein
VKVEILDPRQMGKIGMRALLGVGLGSAKPPRVACDALVGRQRAMRQAGGVHRQGRYLRYRRHLDQAVGRAWRT